MKMTFNDLHAAACAECGQSDLMLKQVLLNDSLEREGRKEFKQERFENCLERAISIYMPYCNPKDTNHVKYGNLYALSVANHRSEFHDEDRADEIGSYTAVILSSFEDGESMVENGMRRWWAG